MTLPSRVLLFGAVPLLMSGHATPAVHRVVIEAHDYAYVVPTTVPAGPTLFEFVNRGRVRHEVQFFRVKAGVTANQARSYLATGDIPWSAVDTTSGAGVLIAIPGDSAHEQLYVDLARGEHYALMCQFQDSSKAPPHATLGMVALLTVR
ncbi:MAG: hypothetical protein KGL93_01320 [Gemmatimonadota bacterium]|nr:hypothetical protein [Gemmatimonadota bacterium]